MFSVAYVIFVSTCAFSTMDSRHKQLVKFIHSLLYLLGKRRDRLDKKIIIIIIQSLHKSFFFNLMLYANYGN